MSRDPRRHFPVLERSVYLNSCATGAFPREMEQVFAEYWGTLASWRDEVWERWWRDLHAYWDEVAAFIGAPPRRRSTPILPTSTGTVPIDA